MILTECAKFSKPLTLCGCERCSHAETNSQRGSDIRSRGSEDRSGEKWLQLSLLAGLQDVPWIRRERERERGWVTYFARRSAPLATQPSSCPPDWPCRATLPAGTPVGRSAGDIFANFFNPLLLLLLLLLLKLQLHIV